MTGFFAAFWETFTLVFIAEVGLCTLNQVDT
jgi:hypothetical protein